MNWEERCRLQLPERTGAEKSSGHLKDRDKRGSSVDQEEAEQWES